MPDQHRLHSRETIWKVKALAHFSLTTTQSLAFKLGHRAKGSYIASILHGTRYAIKLQYADCANGVIYSVAGIPAYTVGHR